MRYQKGIRLYRTIRHPRGMVLITATWIAIALAAVVLVLAREMMVESMTAKQHLNQAKADAAELGMEQFVMSVVAQEMIQPGYKDTTDWELRKIGDCYCWALTYNADDEHTPAFGLQDEAGKIDVNTASYDMLTLLPGMTEDLARQIQDWVDTDDDLADGLTGAETPDYEGALQYRAKNGPMESIDELRLLLALQQPDDPDFPERVLHGADRNHNGVFDASEEDSPNYDASVSSAVGIAPFVTVYGLRATTLPTPTTDPAATQTDGINLTATADTQPTVADVNSTSSNQILVAVLAACLNDQTRAQTIANASQTALGVQAAGGGGRGGAGGATQVTPFANIWDWASKMQTRAQLTQDEFQKIYMNVMCSVPSTQPAATAQASGGIASGTTTTSQPTTRVGRVNVNTAPLPVLMALPGFEDVDAEAILTYREANNPDIIANDPTQLPNIAWLMGQVDMAKLVEAGSYLTGSSVVYSAEIVTVSPDGRAFKRVKIVVDVSTGAPHIIYRQDLTKNGWPLDLSVREKLRKGEELDRIGPTPGI